MLTNQQKFSYKHLHGSSHIKYGHVPHRKKFYRGIVSIIARARVHSVLIGEYVNHNISSDDSGEDIAVTLSNGSLVVPWEAAQIQEDLDNGIQDMWILEIAASFKPQL